jgi:hypothetical protein
MPFDQRSGPKVIYSGFDREGQSAGGCNAFCPLLSARTHASRQLPLQIRVACSIAACTEGGGLPELPVRKPNMVDG